MQRIKLEDNEEITRKEYLKRKKAQSKKIMRKSKITYIMVSFTLILVVYIVIQVIVYKKAHNYSYLADDNVTSQSVYNVYYTTEGYTYSPKYSLSSIYSNGFNDNVILSDLGFTDINISSKYVLGIKNGKLYGFLKESGELSEISDKTISKFTLYNDTIYMIVGDNSKLFSYNLEEKNLVDLSVENISEVLVDENNIFVVKNEKIKKQLYKLDKDGSNNVKMASDANVSYIVQSDTKLYFVNKSDENKIYTINKDTSSYGKVADICSVTDSGFMKNIDGSKYMYLYNEKLYYVNSLDNNNLWKYNLETLENTKEISMEIEILQNVNETVYYKIKNERGVYLYNTDTKFMSEITTRNVNEFVIDTYTKVFIDGSTSK